MTSVEGNRHILWCW